MLGKNDSMPGGITRFTTYNEQNTSSNQRGSNYFQQKNTSDVTDKAKVKHNIT
jgi:hypothetical protein